MDRQRIDHDCMEQVAYIGCQKDHGQRADHFRPVFRNDRAEKGKDTER